MAHPTADLPKTHHAAGLKQLMQQYRAYEELLIGRLDIPDADYEPPAEALRSSCNDIPERSSSRRRCDLFHEFGPRSRHVDLIWDPAVRLHLALVGTEQESMRNDGRHRVEDLDPVVNHVSETQFRADRRFLGP